MAQPSSSHREHRDRDREVRASDRDRERDRERRSSRSHHHHRTISSTTLLLVLSLVLAVLAVMLSLPSNGLPPIGGADPAGGPADSADPQKGVWGILTPKRSQALVQRESQVASREADVARREAELLAGAPGGVLPPPPTPPVVCQVCPTIPAYTAPPPAETIYKEIVTQTEALTPPGWFKEGQMRFEDILDRELKIADREREIGRREESVNRREHDASRREAWIMEQLIALGEGEPQAAVEEEFIYETPRKPVMRAPKYLPIEQEYPPPLIYTETAVATEYKTVTKTQHHTHTKPSTVTMPAPANTRLAAYPTPEPMTLSYSTGIPKTTAVSYVTEEIIEEPEPDVVVVEEEEEIVPARTSVVRNGRGPSSRQPKRWLGGW